MATDSNSDYAPAWRRFEESSKADVNRGFLSRWLCTVVRAGVNEGRDIKEGLKAPSNVEIRHHAHNVVLRSRIEELDIKGEDGKIIRTEHHQVVAECINTPGYPVIRTYIDLGVVPEDTLQAAALETQAGRDAKVATAYAREIACVGHARVDQARKGVVSAIKAERHAQAELRKSSAQAASQPAACSPVFAPA